ncbi:Uma2 family endonuclease [Chloroflexi bacterium TSY]|nr:Uma2 family endonuclease [Chloroflexi bacterium TSY]
MREATSLIEEEQEFDDLGSFNHSLVQANLAYVLKAHTEFSPLNELSLDTSGLDKLLFPAIKDELIADVCLYPKSAVVDLDILVMEEMPLLVIEVISPRQGTRSIIEKFQAYFALGIPSCWLVDPATSIVRIYHPNSEPRTFSSGFAVDEVVGIRVPIAEIFG